MKRHGLAVIALAAAVGVPAAAADRPIIETSGTSVTLRPGGGPVPRQYFGLHISKLLQPHKSGRQSLWPDLDFGSWRLWGAYVAWRDLEPQRGEFRFTRLDTYVRLAQTKNVELILTFGYTPTWASARPGEPCVFGTRGCAAEPADLDDWRDFVSTVAKRYKGQIRAYELWNEPQFDEDGEHRQPDQTYYSGSAASMVAMGRVAYRAIKDADPAAIVLSPAVVSSARRLDTFLRLGGTGTFDVVAYHFYGAPPERMVDDTSALKRVLARYGLDRLDIWNTEMGYYFERPRLGIAPTDRRQLFSDVIPERLAAAYVVRALTLGAALGLKRFEWYDWDSETPPSELPMGLASDDGSKPNAAGRAYARAIQWLRGWTIDNCTGQKAGLWSCLLHQDGPVEYLVWSAGSNEGWRVPAPGGYAMPLEDGACFRKVAAGAGVDVGPMPWVVLMAEAPPPAAEPLCDEAGHPR
ncbi:MAG: endo-1,4-beta-xylanase [Proteobacteria bacterium]|nr:endo-1,4-beta-xylanase [Pseudomonadota bacterium]